MVDLLAVLLVSLGSFFLEVGPLVVHFVELLLQTLYFHFALLELVFCVTELQFEFRDVVVVGVEDGLLLLAESGNETIVSLFAVFGLLRQRVLQSLDLPQVLGFLQLDSVSFEVGLLDASLALIGQILNGLLSLFVNRHLLLLVLQKRNQVVVFLSSGVQLVGARPQLVFELHDLGFGPLQLLPDILLFGGQLVDFFRQKIGFTRLLLNEFIMRMLDDLELFGNDSGLAIELLFDQLQIADHLVHFLVRFLSISQFHLDFCEVLLEFCMGDFEGRDLVVPLVVNLFHLFVPRFFVLGPLLQSQILRPQRFLFLSCNVQIPLEHGDELVLLDPLNLLLLVGHEHVGAARLFALGELGLEDVQLVAHQTVLLLDLVLLLFKLQNELGLLLERDLVLLHDLFVGFDEGAIIDELRDLILVF